MVIDVNSDRPIFVVGTPRSGTTLAARLLGRHSRIFMPGETHFFDDVYSRAGRLGDLQDSAGRLEISRRLHSIYDRFYEPDDQRRIIRLFPEVQDLAQALDDCTSYAMVLDRFMTLQMQSEGKSRWGNNAPRDLFSVRAIREFFPDAKLIVCVRDIRAFLYSYKGKWKVASGAGDQQVTRLRKLYHPVITSYLWKASMQQLPLVEGIVPPADRIIVRYEDLVSDPEKIMKNICATIGEEYEPDMLAIEGHNSSTATETTGIFTSSVDRWMMELSQEEIAISQNIAGGLLNRLGYKATPVHADRARLYALWASAPFSLWRALSANRGTRGPLLPYLYRRVGALLGIGR